MNCEQTNELLEEFVLGTLSLGEQGAIQAHITGCRKHDDALTELQSVVDRLPLAAPEREPPASLRSGLLERFEEETAREAQPAPLPASRPIFTRPAFWPAAIAALLLVAIGLGAWSLALSLGDDSGEVRAVFSGASGEGTVLYLQDEQLAVLDVTLPALEGQVYQAWGMFDGTVESLGLPSSEGVTAFRHDLSDADGVAISVEPPGGSEQPTTDPILVATFP